MVSEVRRPQAQHRLPLKPPILLPTKKINESYVLNCSYMVQDQKCA